MGLIRLKNMVFYGYHGVDEEEKVLGGKFEVDLEIGFDMTNAMNSDDLEDTISYPLLYEIVKKCVTKSNFYLIEALGGQIIKELFERFDIEKACVRVRKPGAPIPGVLDTVEVEIQRTREQMTEA